MFNRIIIIVSFGLNILLFGQHPSNNIRMKVSDFDINFESLNNKYKFYFEPVCNNDKADYPQVKIAKYEFLENKPSSDFIYLSINLSDYAGGRSLIKTAPIINDSRVIIFKIQKGDDTMNIYLGFKKFISEGKSVNFTNFQFRKGNYYINITDNMSDHIDFSKRKKLVKRKLKNFLDQANCFN